MSDRDLEAQIEAAISAYRERTPEGHILPSPDWRDLSPEERERAAREAELQRTMEAALDEEGLSSTARAVLSRIPTSK